MKIRVFVDKIKANLDFGMLGLEAGDARPESKYAEAQLVTFAEQLTLRRVGSMEDSYLQEMALCRAHKKKGAGRRRHAPISR